MTRRGNDLRLITLVSTCLAIGCGVSDPPSTADAAADSRKNEADASAIADAAHRDAASDAAAEDDDAPRGVVVLPAQFVEVNEPLRMLAEGDIIELWPAPQGGHVVLVAAKVKNFIGDTAMLRVKARYPDTPFVVAEEARTVKLVPVPGEPDTMQPDLQTRTQVAHIPLCPDYDPMDIVDRPLEFAVTVTSFGSDEPQSGAATLRLHPTCVAGKVDKPLCQCECSANYVLGKCARDAASGD